jgi:hypothetical protein
MPSNNISQAIVFPIDRAIDKNLVYTKRTNFLKKEILARCGRLVLIPLSATTAALDVALGTIGAAGALLTQGRNKSLCSFAMKHLDASSKILAQPYANLLKTFDPKNSLSGSTVGAAGEGIIADVLVSTPDYLAERCKKSNNFIVRHIASRLTYVLLATACLIARAVDGVIGALALPLSLITLGKCRSINALAYRGLQAPGILKDLCHYIVKFINPWAEINLAAAKAASPSVRRRRVHTL